MSDNVIKKKVLLEDKGRKYRRYRPSSEEKILLANKGMQWVLSSNVSAIGVDKDDLIIRFHNGSIYRYFKKADKINSILTSNSKGHWVWVNLRRKNVNYQKIGYMPLESDTLMSDEDMFEKLDTEAIRVESPQVLDERDIVKPISKNINILKAVATISILNDLTGNTIDVYPINIITKIRQM